MFSYSLKKYFNNFGKIFPFIVINIVFDAIILRLCFISIGVTNIFKTAAVWPNNWKFSFNGIDFSTITASTVIFIIIAMLAQPIFSAFIRLLIKRILKDEKIYYIEILAESFNYYLRLIGLYIVLVAIVLALFIGGMLLGFIPVLGPVLIIIMVFFALFIFIILSPVEEYLIYHDCHILEALSESMEIGKRYFWYLLLLAIAQGILDNIFKNSNAKGSITYLVISFIKLVIEGILIMYRMNLCRGEAEENTF
jgi:hypothetical protein